MTSKYPVWDDLYRMYKEFLLDDEASVLRFIVEKSWMRGLDSATIARSEFEGGHKKKAGYVNVVVIRKTGLRYSTVLDAVSRLVGKGMLHDPDVTPGKSTKYTPVRAPRVGVAVRYIMQKQAEYVVNGDLLNTLYYTIAASEEPAGAMSYVVTRKTPMSETRLKISMDPRNTPVLRKTPMSEGHTIYNRELRSHIFPSSIYDNSVLVCVGDDAEETGTLLHFKFMRTYADAFGDALKNVTYPAYVLLLPTLRSGSMLSDAMAKLKSVATDAATKSKERRTLRIKKGTWESFQKAWSDSLREHWPDIIPNYKVQHAANFKRLVRKGFDPCEIVSVAQYSVQYWTQCKRSLFKVVDRKDMPNLESFISLYERLRGLWLTTQATDNPYESNLAAKVALAPHEAGFSAASEQKSTIAPKPTSAVQYTNTPKTPPLPIRKPPQPIALKRKLLSASEAAEERRRFESDADDFKEWGDK